jgi:exosome complex exonuclease DIS3/RRP44
MLAVDLTCSHRLGIEGLVTFKRETKFDPDQYTIAVPSHDDKDVTVAVFDKVTVSVSVEKDKNTQRGRVKMTLVKPVDSRAL